MKVSSFVALAAASLAAAAPASESINLSGHNFNVTNFVFGCTVGCNWSFDVSVEGKSANHPAVKKPVHCEGSFEDTDYVKCGKIKGKPSLDISAYIVKDTSALKLEYEVSQPSKNKVYRYYGHKKVYAATSSQAALQKPDFKVKETRATGVA